MNAIETMKKSLKENLVRQSECKDLLGLRIKPDRMKDYGTLVREARDLQDGIRWLKENVYKEEL